MTLTTERVTFTGALGEELAARLDRPAGTPRAFALFAHCFSCSKDIRAASRISKALAAQGIAVLRFDFTGLGQSDGDFANTNFSSNVEDLVAAARFLEESHQAPQVLVGHSLGGTAVLLAGASLASVKAVVTIGSPADPQHVSHNFEDHIREIEQKGVAEVDLGGRPFTIKKQFLDDIRSTKVVDGLPKLKKALLVMHAPQDSYVSIDHATRIFTGAKHPKRCVSLDTADHRLRADRDAAYAGGVISSWVIRYLDPVDATDAVKPPEGEVIVREDGSGKYANVVLAGRHELRAGEPASVGGNDAGPTPYDYLTAALGACTSMTVRMYADRKKWPLTSVAVRLRHEKKHADDCDGCKGKLDHISRWVSLDGDLDSEQRARLLEIADRCPVHKTLTTGAVISTDFEG